MPGRKIVNQNIPCNCRFIRSVSDTSWSRLRLDVSTVQRAFFPSSTEVYPDGGYDISFSGKWIGVRANSPQDFPSNITISPLSKVLCLS